jgi:predicted metal-dependent hydrolase
MKEKVMKVRMPKMDFSKVPVHWAPNPEFAQSYNAFSTVPAHIEPYLIKVMVAARDKVDPKYAELRTAMEIFIKQEVQHCKLHLNFNKHLVQSGYVEMLPIEAEYKADYERFLRTRSLRFNIAYSEGFESMGCAAAQVFFEDLDQFLDGADQLAADLWRWHLAEEFEHREVCYQVYKTLYGNGIYSYLYRVYGFITAIRHIGGHTKRLAAVMIAKDRQGMTPEQLKASEQRLAHYQKTVKKASLKRLVQVLSPFYDPARRVASPGMAELLARY